MIGRGSTEPLFEKGSGLRGFMEIAFREERLRASTANSAGFQRIGQIYPRKAVSTVLRIGAKTDLGGNGLVQQKGPNPGFSVQSSLNFSHSNQPFYLSFDSQTLWKCGSPRVSCGAALLYLFTMKSEFQSAVPELRHFATLGPVVNVSFAKRYYLGMQISWSYLKGQTNMTGETVTAAAPFVQSTFTVAF